MNSNAESNTGLKDARPVTAPKKEKKARKGRKKGRHFNIIDVLIILAVLAGAALVAAVYMPGIFGSTQETVGITYVLEIEGVSPELASAISVGDTVTDEKGYTLGHVASGVAVEDYYIMSYDSTAGEVVSSPHPQLNSLHITVYVNAESDPELGYSVNGKRIAVGASYSIILNSFTGEGRCISLYESASSGGEN